MMMNLEKDVKNLQNGEIEKMKVASNLVFFIRLNFPLMP